jgi:hypothetical protein
VGPAHDASGRDVDDGGQVEPALLGSDAGDVTAPARVDRRRVGLEVAKHQVRTEDGMQVRDGCAVSAAAGAAGESGLPHQPCDPAASAPLALAFEDRVDA